MRSHSASSALLSTALLWLAAAPRAIAYPDGALLSLQLRQSDYDDTICQPATRSPSDTIPPCVEIQTIEEVCIANGTSPLALKAHQECMCTGSFFTEWPFCLACLYLHGQRSQRDVAFYSSVLAAASTALCDVPTPSATFAAVFTSAQAAIAYPTVGSTATSDRAPGQSAVSLYYTASGSQGPGRITGEATTATATGERPTPSSSSGGSAAETTTAGESESTASPLTISTGTTRTSTSSSSSATTTTSTNGGSSSKFGGDDKLKLLAILSLVGIVGAVTAS
ncbi:hypothetical protein B0T17DRAFT_612403 [Bombardia bombarda]|uniref:Uncharacterized protein n=1 Tax=Bombardia bombarda TaxID=252184 RepID=A0AA40CEI9_9PEZI|nr:hypothetical protein B0T17DRAFT_612403 [Bombardia bombarda]